MEVSLGSIRLSDILRSHRVPCEGGCVAVPDDLGSAEQAQSEASDCQRCHRFYCRVVGDSSLMYLISVRCASHMEPSFRTMLQPGKNPHFLLVCVGG